MTGKPPVPQAISALLRKAGFKRSTSSASRIKGWRNYSEGYYVTGYSYEVEVGHRTENRWRGGPGASAGDAGAVRRGDPCCWLAGEAITRQVLIVTAK